MVIKSLMYMCVYQTVKMIQTWMYFILTLHCNVHVHGFTSMITMNKHDANWNKV